MNFNFRFLKPFRKDGSPSFKLQSSLRIISDEEKRGVEIAEYRFQTTLKTVTADEQATLGLLDDMMTSGRTLSDCVRELVIIGARAYDETLRNQQDQDNNLAETINDMNAQLRALSAVINNLQAGGYVTADNLRESGFNDDLQISVDNGFGDW